MSPWTPSPEDFLAEDVEAAIRALDTVRSSWLRDPDVVAVDVGYFTTEGHLVDPTTQDEVRFATVGGKRVRIKKSLDKENVRTLKEKVRVLRKRLKSTIEPAAWEKYWQDFEGTIARLRCSTVFAKSDAPLKSLRAEVGGLMGELAAYGVGRADKKAVEDALRALTATDDLENPVRTLRGALQLPPTARSKYGSGTDEDTVWLQTEIASSLKSPDSVHSYSKAPWIRVHVKRKLAGDAVRDQKKLDYSTEEVEDPVTGKTFFVHVVEALYEELQGPKKTQDLEERIESLEETVRKGRDEMRTRFRPAYLESCEVDRSARVEPLVGGISIGNAHRSGGTLGAIVWDRTDCQPCILSNAHVLGGSGGATEGERCLQPSMGDGGSPETDTVARLKRWSVDDEVDAAVAGLAGERDYCTAAILGDEASGGTIAINGALAEPKPSHTGLLGRTLRKSGLGSGFTKGYLDGVAASVFIEYADGTRKMFHDQIHIVPEWMGTGEAPKPEAEVSMPGDSGALWVTDDDNKAVALQFAGDTAKSPLGDFALAHPIWKVAEKLKVSFSPLFRPPEEIEERQEKKLRAALAVPGGVPVDSAEAAKRLAEVVSDILRSVLEKFTVEEVGSAIDRLKRVVGPQPPLPKPPGGAP